MCKVLKTYLTHNKILMDVRGYTTHSVIKESTDVPICTTVGGTIYIAGYANSRVELYFDSAHRCIVFTFFFLSFSVICLALC